MKLTSRDLIFGGINGLIFGILSPVVIQAFHAPKQPHYLLVVLFFTILAPIGIFIGYQLGKIKPFFFQLAKFGATGAANFAIDIGIFLFLLFSFNNNENTAIPWFTYATFKTISFVMASINSYLWNKFWSFQDKDTDDIPQELSKFILVSAIGALINVSTSTISNSLYNSSNPQMDIEAWGAIAAIIGSICAFSWNFIGYKLLVFKK